MIKKQGEKMSKGLQDFILSGILILSGGMFLAALVIAYNGRMDRAWTIHDCVMEKWVDRETVTGSMPTQWEEHQWRRQCTQAWSAMPPKRG
jgi:hypothetical protein